MNARKIPLYKVLTDRHDVEQVRRVIERGTYWAVGPEIEQFERAVADYVGRKHAVAFNSGTSALHAAMLACGIGHGDEVITPSFTFIATANAPLFVGAAPIFADIESETYGLDVQRVSEKISKDTKAIMPVHYGGLVCRDIRQLKKVAQEHNVLLIEDAAEALGSIAYGQKAGSFGDVAVFSFCGNKVITTGEGGIAVTNSGELFEKLKLVRSHGRLEKEPYFLTTKSLDYVELGFNWRMPTMIAALGISQMDKLEKVISMRRKIASQLSAEFRKVDAIQVPEEPQGFRHIYQMYTIQVKDGTETRQGLQQHLSKCEIATKIYFEPVHLTSFYRNRLAGKVGSLPETERISASVLTLPIYPMMTSAERRYLARSVTQYFCDSDS
jgi:dTDP-4-amino-4,6-dideoxygalactose transaminase